MTDNSQITGSLLIPDQDDRSSARKKKKSQVHIRSMVKDPEQMEDDEYNPLCMFNALSHVHAPEDNPSATSNNENYSEININKSVKSNPNNPSYASNEAIGESQYETEEEEEVRKKNFWKRTFTKLGPGSLRASIVTLAAAALSSGILALPYVFVLAGAVLGTILLFLGFVFSVWSNFMILSTAEKIKSSNYKEFCLKSGGKGLSLTLDWSICITIYGATTGFQVIITQLMERNYKVIGLSDKTSESLWLRAIQVVIFSVCVIFPLCNLKKMTSLRYATFLSVFSICYTIIVIIILIVECPFYFNQNFHHEKYKFELFKVDMGFFDACATTFMAFTCQQSVFAIFGELTNPIKRRMQKVVLRSLILDLILYFAISYAGYLSTFSATDIIVVNREPLETHTTLFQVLITIGRVGLVIALIIGVPVNFNPARLSTHNLLFKDPENLSTKRAFWTALVYCICSALIAIFFPKIRAIISVVGGLGCVSLCYIIPIWAFISIQKKKCSFHVIVNLFLCIVLSLLGIASVVRTFYLICTGQYSS